MSIRHNYLNVIEKIDNACLQSGRSSSDVKLVVVTKGRTKQQIIEVVSVGAEFLGENYPEETDRKIQELAGSINPEWHMIGHIQSRKIKYLIKHFSMIHSIDSVTIAEKLNNACSNNNIILPVLLEVSLSGEETKHGFILTNSKEETNFFHAIDAISRLQALDVRGLMTMPPLEQGGHKSRQIFEKCRILLENIRKPTGIPGFLELSMGTSQDYEVAIQCGATLVRIGEAIFGPRF